MKTILYMAITANGLIAKEDGSVDWTSQETWKDSYFPLIKKIGNIVIGGNTYAIMPPEEFLPEILYVVFTKSKPLKKKVPNVIFTNQTPKEVLKILGDKGFEEICVGGGGMINSSFIKEGLVDEVILDVEPIVFGKGIQLFAQEDFEYKLKLLSVKNLNKNTIQLHYKVLK